MTIDGYIDIDEALRDERVTPFFSRGDGFHAGPDVQEPPAPLIRATPYVHRDPRTIPPRQWLFGRHYVRKFVSATVAPGGVGKTSNSYAEATSMVSGRALLGGTDTKPLRVWVWNGEDPIDEIERRFAAIILRYKLSSEEDIGDRLFIDSGRATPVIIATKLRDETVVAKPLVQDLVREIQERRIDVLIVDPFVSSHGVPENDNGAIDRVVKTWAGIADETGCAIELIHHVRKPANGAQADFTVDDARGAVALIGGVRSARVLNVMTKEDAEKADVPPEARRSYFRVDDGKSNMMPPIEKAVWRKLVGVQLGNQTEDDPGDWVGVVEAWNMPSAFDDITPNDIRKVQAKIADGQWADNVQAQNWAGYAVAEALEIDADNPSGKLKIKTLLKTWIANKMLKVERQHSARDGRERPMIVVGERA